MTMKWRRLLRELTGNQGPCIVKLRSWLNIHDEWKNEFQAGLTCFTKQLLNLNPCDKTKVNVEI